MNEEPGDALEGVIRMDGLEAIIGLQVGINHSLLVQGVDPKLKACNLTAKQVTIMWLVDANPGITQSRIARFLAVERSTIHQFVRILLRNELIKLAKSEMDGRLIQMFLTNEGRQALAKAREIIHVHEAEATAPLIASERNDRKRRRNPALTATVILERNSA